MTSSRAAVVIESDLMTKPLVDLWNVLLDVSERVGTAWSLIGGQMVLLHGLEHGRTPPAASVDLDVLADVLSDQQSLRRLVAALGELGFVPAGMSPQGNLLHRYQRDTAEGTLKVDVLAPTIWDRAQTSRPPLQDGPWRFPAVGRPHSEPNPFR